MAEATGNLAQWRLIFSELEFDIVHSAIINHQASDVLSCIKTNNVDKTTLKVEVSVLTIPKKIACAPKKEATDINSIEEPIGPFAFFIPEVCGKDGLTDSIYTKIPTIAEFISA